MNRRFFVWGGLVLGVAILSMMLFRGKDVEVTQEQTPAVGARMLYMRAVRLRQDHNLVRARRVYQEILKKHPDADNIASVQKELEELTLDIIFSNIPVADKSVMHEVVIGDTLGEIAGKYGTTIALIKKGNHLKSDVIRIGQKLRVWKGKFNIFVDKSRNILILKDNNEVVKVYSVATGEYNSTPVGTFKIVTKLIDPVWFTRGVVVPPESPQNVLGSRWLGFDLPGYGIHGTTDPESIGRQLTAGCVRMFNEDVEELYSLVPAGTEVVVVD